MIAVFDVETTGLPLAASAPLELQPRIIELGVLLLDDQGNETYAFSELVHPGMEISAEITKITGITNADLEGKPPFAKFVPVLRDMFGRASAVFAHNMPFDRGLLTFDLRRIGMTLADVCFPDKQICTVQTFSPIWGRRPKLTELYEWSLGEPLKQTHRAVDDCRALAKVLVKENMCSPQEKT